MVNRDDRAKPDFASNDRPRKAPLFPPWVKSDLRRATGRGVRIGVIDSGRDPGWVESQVQPGVGLVNPEEDFVAVPPTTDDQDRIGHGTACADLILRMAPEVEVFPIRVFNQRLETSVPLLNASLQWAVENRMHIVNLSLGTLLENSLKPLYRACEVARRKGLILVSAVNRSTGWSYPAVFENAIGVQIGDFADDFDYRYEPEGAFECIAKGDGPVRWLEGIYKEVSGSSFAAPRITAIVALFLQRHPGASLEEVRQLLAKYSRLAVGGSQFAVREK